jgi:hypothetical protein
LGILASSPSSASAGGHELQPCEVNSSTTTGLSGGGVGACALAAMHEAIAPNPSAIALSSFMRRRPPQTMNYYQRRSAVNQAAMVDGLTRSP